MSSYTRIEPDTWIFRSPSITMATFFAGLATLPRAVIYITAQITGAIVGAYWLRLGLGDAYFADVRICLDAIRGTADYHLGCHSRMHDRHKPLLRRADVGSRIHVRPGLNLHRFWSWSRSTASERFWACLGSHPRWRYFSVGYSGQLFCEAGLYRNV
jgi:hypothetical protein